MVLKKFAKKGGYVPLTFTTKALCSYKLCSYNNKKTCTVCRFWFCAIFSNQSHWFPCNNSMNMTILTCTQNIWRSHRARILHTHHTRFRQTHHTRFKIHLTHDFDIHITHTCIHATRTCIHTARTCIHTTHKILTYTTHIIFADMARHMHVHVSNACN